MFRERLTLRDLNKVIIGETCLGKLHTTSVVNTNKPHVLRDGRNSVFKPCRSELSVQVCGLCGYHDSPYDPVSQRTKDDNTPAPSVDDRAFIGIGKDSLGRWTAPLPFRSDRPRLPNNRDMAMKRARQLCRSLDMHPEKR